MTIPKLYHSIVLEQTIRMRIRTLHNSSVATRTLVYILNKPRSEQDRHDQLGLSHTESKPSRYSPKHLLPHGC
jgi:hypothetical protein